jgi:lipid-A-disaccharide synthase
MKKIFVLTGEPSGDKLASKVVSKLQQNYSDIEYLSVGGSHLNRHGVKSIYDLKEITYIGFTSVFFNILKIRNKINITVKKIIEFNPDILLSVDSPDFTLRVAEKVKKINPKIKTIHYVAPQVWVWRRGRVKKFKKFLDHILLLFNFEKKYFDKENIKNTFVGHPLLENKELIKDELKKKKFSNVEVISDESIKFQILSKSIFAVAKSGTVSLEICNLKVPSIIIYKMNVINFLIVKFLVKVKFANIINIINQKEIIPELIQNECNAKEIFRSVVYFLKNPELMNKQINDVSNTLNQIKSKTSSSAEASAVVLNYLDV